MRYLDMIPRIIHQIWGVRDDGEMPAQFHESEASWRLNHPDWTYILWRRDSIDRLIQDHYPHVWDLYRRYPEWIQRADASRYFILHHHGGIYSDLDIICRRSWADLLAHDMIVPRTAPLGVSNDLMAAEKGNEFVAYLIDCLESQSRRWQHWYIPRHFRILLTTGSLFLTQAYRGYPKNGTIYILSPELYGNSDRKNAYVAHVAGNSWAGWDTYMFVFVHRYWRWIAGFAAATIAAITLR
jgi:inositol phosphorylceramide mannosyltransferase catalytic subunit